MIEQHSHDFFTGSTSSELPPWVEAWGPVAWYSCSFDAPGVLAGVLATAAGLALAVAWPIDSPIRMSVSTGLDEFCTRSASNLIWPGWKKSNTVEPPNPKYPWQSPFFTLAPSSWKVSRNEIEPTTVAPTTIIRTNPKCSVYSSQTKRLFSVYTLKLRIASGLTVYSASPTCHFLPTVPLRGQCQRW